MTQALATLEKVRAAILEIMAEGGVPTNKAIRRKLGGGSYKHINPMRRQVLEELEVLEQAGCTDLSAEIKKAIFQDRKRAVDEATLALRKKMESHRQQADEAMEDLEEAEEKIEALLGQSAAERADHQQELRRLEIVAARAEERLRALEEMLQQERGKVESAIREREQLRTQTSLLGAEVKRAEEAAADARRQAEELDSQFRTAVAACATAGERAAVAEQHAKDTEAAFRAAKQQGQELRRELRKLQGEHRTLTGKWLEMQDFLANGRSSGA